MKKLMVILFFFLYSIPFWAQAEYKKVREMFDVPHTNIDQYVYKGHLDGVHPVEFFLGKRSDQVKGYYRLVSSGETFLLEGESQNNYLVLSEFNKNGEQLGTFECKSCKLDEMSELDLLWKSIANQDALNFSLQKHNYSDFAPLAHKSSLRKFCDFKNNECFTIEIYEENKADLVWASAKREPIFIESIDPLVFHLKDSTKFEFTSQKLRSNNKGQFLFYDEVNQAEFKRLYYASADLLSDVEYPILNHEGFDRFIADLVAEEKRKTQKELKSFQKDNSSSQENTHFQYKWNGWTEIDCIGSSYISGRLILNKSISGKTEKNVFPFIFDLSNNRNYTFFQQFKSDVDIRSYLARKIENEIALNSSFADLESKDFKYFSLSENNVLISTDFSHAQGISVIKIPYSDLKTWMKRNSLIKKIMRS